MPTSSLKLPKRSLAAAEPVHLRLAEICRNAILSGKYAPGDRFPSERELAERYEVSRATANKVISALIAGDLLELQKGIGTRVRRRPTLFASLDGMESFTAHAREQGLEPSTEVLEFERAAVSSLPDKVRDGLEISGKTSERVVYLERLRLAGGIPMILEYRWVNAALAPGLDRADVEGSFYHVLEEKFGLIMTGEKHAISAVILDRTAANLFRISEPAAALQVEGTGYVNGDQPLWFQRLFYRGDHYQLLNQTGSSSPAIELRLNATPIQK